MYDLIIHNALLYEAENGRFRPGAVAVAEGKLASLDPLPSDEAAQRIDAGQAYLTPGFVDFHTHVCHRIHEFSMPAELAEFPCGVTTVVDAGSVGIGGYEGFYHGVVQTSLMRIKTFLHVSSVGQMKNPALENLDPALFNADAIRRLCLRYADNIIGLKVKQNRAAVREHGFAPLRRAAAIARECGLQLSVHASDPPGNVATLLELLEPGDIFCHMYHGQGSGILDARGRVRPEVVEARARGVLFEVAHGSMQFSCEVARQAIDQGFLPDIVSSDLSLLSWNKPPAYSFSCVVSALLNLGLTVQDVCRCCISTPASLLGEAGVGRLEAGAPADLAVWRVAERPFAYQDRYGDGFAGSRLAKNELTVCAGNVVHRAFDFIP